MPFVTPSRELEFQAAVSNNQQAAWATPLADGVLTKVLSLDNLFAPRPSRNARSDRGKFGKGYEWATKGGHLTRTKDAPISIQGDLSSYVAGWLGMFGLGSVSSVQPDGAGNPTVWRHTFKPFDPIVAVTKQPPVTTIYTQAGSAAAFKLKLRAMAIARFAITGEARNDLKFSCDMIGSGERVQDPVTVGAPTALSYLDMGGMVFTLGPQAAAVDLSERLVSFRCEADQDLDAPNGYHPGSGLYRGRLWIGSARKATWAAQVWLKEDSADILGYWDAENVLEAKFKITGPPITGTYFHDLEIFYPALRVSEVPIGSRDGKMIHEISVSENDVYLDSTAGVPQPIQIIVTNTETAYGTAS